MEYKRICPECSKEIIYKSKGAMNNANKINSLCHSCAELKIYSIKRYGDLSEYNPCNTLKYSPFLTACFALKKLPNLVVNCSVLYIIVIY